MTPGRNVDEIIAKHFFNLGAAPPYSTDIQAAWLIIEELQKAWMLSLDFEDGNWEITAHKGLVCYTAWAKTAPHAIAMIALKIIGMEKP